MSDYLWDKTGAPEPDVERLERLLGPLAYGKRPLPTPKAPRPRGPRLSRWAAVAAVAMAVVLGLVLVRPWRAKEQVASWPVSLDGAASRLALGAWLETGTHHAQLIVPAIGTVDLEAGARARIVETGAAKHRLELQQGTLRAHIDAPPRHFAVETAHAIVTDLGCAFTVAVDGQGRGHVEVSGGKVAVSDRAARELEVPAGAACELTEKGPGAPYFVDASPAFIAALARVDRDPSALAVVLKEARKKDRLTLAALPQDPSVRERLNELDRPERVEPPATVPKPAHPPATKKRAAPAHKPAHKAAQKISQPAHSKAADKPVTSPDKKSSRIKIEHDALKDLEHAVP